jgi:hypothetical protein
VIASSAGSSCSCMPQKQRSCLSSGHEYLANNVIGLLVATAA